LPLPACQGNAARVNNVDISKQLGLQERYGKHHYGSVRSFSKVPGFALVPNPRIVCDSRSDGTSSVVGVHLSRASLTSNEILRTLPERQKQWCFVVRYSVMVSAETGHDDVGNKNCNHERLQVRKS